MMLEKLDLTKSMGKSEYKEKMVELEARIGRLQRECRSLGIPVMIAFEGYGASGKGLQIGELIQALDPRGFEVYAVKNETKEEQMHPRPDEPPPRAEVRSGIRAAKRVPTSGTAG